MDQVKLLEETLRTSNVGRKAAESEDVVKFLEEIGI